MLLMATLAVGLGWREHTRTVHYSSHRQLAAEGAMLSDGWEDPIGPDFFWTWDWSSFKDTKTNGYYKHKLGLGDWFPESPLCTTGDFNCIIHDVERSRVDLSLLPNLLHLKRVDLVGNEIEAQKLAIFSRIAELNILTLGIDGMTDEHLKYLQRLRNLEILCVANGTYSRGALEALRQSLPHCEIMVGQTN